MKIGIFDSGLGGLYIANAMRARLPEYDYVYLGDTLHVPYGRRSVDTVYQLTRNAIEHLFAEEDCAVIIVACNTASALALRRIQQEYLVDAYPDRRVLGVIVPTLEYAAEHDLRRIGMLATEAMCNSGIYEEELGKINADIKLFAQSAPLLVPMLEHGGADFIDQALDKYLTPLVAQNIDSIILGCTHYCLLKEKISRYLGADVRVVSQDELIPEKLATYLKKHAWLEAQIGKNGRFALQITDISESFCEAARSIVGSLSCDIKKVVL
tara:strand:- start:95259 stop:96062 length:804 start_codon:yes stop_codon:yes gene_type:complete